MSDDSKVSYRCSSDKCHNKFTVKYDGWYPSKPCPKCGDSARMITGDENDKTYNFGIVSRKNENIQAFVKDQAGQSFGVTTDGKLIPERHTPYDTKRDKHGWYATGRKVKGHAKGYKPRGWQD